MLFVGMLAALVGQANTRDILQRLVLNSTQGFSKQRFTGEKTEWSPQGGYGYFVTATVAQPCIFSAKQWLGLEQL